MESGKGGSLGHLFMTVFLYCFSSFMVIPAITDVTLAAICPGKEKCSLAIYLSGIQQAITGMGSLVMMPLVGNLSDTYGRKFTLTIPMFLTIFPLAILAYSRTKVFFYAYFVLKTLISMATEGSVHSIALAYVADNVPENRRGAVFGILSGIVSCSFVCGNFSTRFLSTSAIFQMATGGSVIALVYMKIFLQESITRNPEKPTETDCLLDKSSEKTSHQFKALPSFNDTISFLRDSPTFSQAAVISFASTVAEVGLSASLLYYLKAQFHFDKDQFADLMVIGGIAGTVSQLVLMPILAPALGDGVLLSVGLFFSVIYMVLNSIAWSSWVPYAASVVSTLSLFAIPCLRSIASKQVGPCEQGKAQGCLTGISSFANIVSPLVFSPLTGLLCFLYLIQRGRVLIQLMYPSLLLALFLSERAPFHFPGFSIACAAFAGMIAFTLSIALRKSQPGASSGTSTVGKADFVEP